MYCGLDFGTSNSVISIAQQHQLKLIPLEQDSAILPSAIFFDYETNEVCFGRQALQRYIVGTEGRLLSAIKSILGTSLQHDATFVKGKAITFQQIITLFLTHIKTQAEQYLQQTLDKVVLGRPVHFADFDPKQDAAAEQLMREICTTVGFQEVVFQLEPIAALNGLTTQQSQEQLILVVDIGGGTSDFSVILRPKAAKGAPMAANQVLANTGVHIGGTDFDRVLAFSKIMPLLGLGTNLRHKNLPFPDHFFVSLSDWSKLTFLYTKNNLLELQTLASQSAAPEQIGRLLKVINHRLGHELLLNVEQAKIDLSTHPATNIDLSCIEDNLSQLVVQQDLASATTKLLHKISQTITECLAAAGTTAAKIDAVLFTGGSTLLPSIRQLVAQHFPEAQIIEADKFGAVAKGLAYQSGMQ